MRLLVHKSCFDGIVSGAAAVSLLSFTHNFKRISLVPVDYSEKNNWLTNGLKKNTCVVDFLYHPKAEFWWDHHKTTFLSEEAYSNFQEKSSPFIQFDPESKSCASMILKTAQILSVKLNDHVLEAIKWADITDSAAYESAEQAVVNQPIARQIALSFADDDSVSYHESMLDCLSCLSLEDIAKKEPFVSSIKKSQLRYKKGLKLMIDSSNCIDGLVTYKINLGNLLVDRMMPYFVFPKANYSLGLVVKKDHIHLTSNRNPWIGVGDINLSTFFTRFGGGGHQNVASVVIGKHELVKAETIFSEICMLMKQAIKIV